MRVVIIGAGEVGTSVAANLAPDHNVIVVDTDEQRTEQLQYELDVLTLTGDGTSLSTLETADIAESDLFLACTDDDQVNLVACGAAKTVADPFTIARVRTVDYLRTWQRTGEAFAVDFMVCSVLLTAETIVRIIGLPSAVDIDLFAGGRINVAEFEIPESSPVAGQTIAEADRFDSLTFAGLFRNDDLLLPAGDTRVEPDDRAVVIGSPESVQAFALDIGASETPETADDIAVVGGSEIGYHTARLLEERSLAATLIEADEDRARQISEELPETTVMNHDPTDTDFLERERIDEADVLVAALGTDEQNLLVAVLSKRLGVERVLAVVENPEYITLFEEIGIDVAINPRGVTAEEITRFSFDSAAENLAVLENDRANVLELELGPESSLVGRSIQELDADISGTFVIGAVIRNLSVLTPRGDTELEPGDHIVVFAEPDVATEIASMA
jgi:trk system potassium uptake protein TrkA